MPHHDAKEGDAPVVQRIPELRVDALAKCYAACVIRPALICHEMKPVDRNRPKIKRSVFCACQQSARVKAMMPQE